MGKNLSEIAEELGTSKSNISHILKTAKKNIEKSEKTLELIKTIEWPILLEFEAGSNLYEISEKIFEKADKNNIHLDYKGSELVRLLGERTGENTKDRKIQSKLRIAISGEGKVSAFYLNPSERNF